MASSDEHPLNGSDCFLTIFEYNLRDMETLRNEVQFSNAQFPKNCTESGMSIDSNAEHSMKAAKSICLSVSGNLMVRSAVHTANAKS